jgi:hypothetical protein
MGREHLVVLVINVMLMFNRILRNMSQKYCLDYTDSELCTVVFLL